MGFVLKGAFISLQTELLYIAVYKSLAIKQQLSVTVAAFVLLSPGSLVVTRLQVTRAGLRSDLATPFQRRGSLRLGFSFFFQHDIVTDN